MKSEILRHGLCSIWGWDGALWGGVHTPPPSDALEPPAKSSSRLGTERPDPHVCLCSHLSPHILHLYNGFGRKLKPGPSPKALRFLECSSCSCKAACPQSHQRRESRRPRGLSWQTVSCVSKFTTLNSLSPRDRLLSSFQIISFGSLSPAPFSSRAKEGNKGFYPLWL